MKFAYRHRIAIALITLAASSGYVLGARSTLSTAQKAVEIAKEWQKVSDRYKRLSEISASSNLSCLDELEAIIRNGGAIQPLEEEQSEPI